jgi:hypothetical protein
MENDNSTNVENHKIRKSYVKDIQKNERVIIPIMQVQYDCNKKDDKIGIQIGVSTTNAYKKRLKTEKYNFSTWFERVKRAKEFGKKLQLINDENNYNISSKYYEDKEYKRLQNLIDIYGKEVGTKIYNKKIT